MADAFGAVNPASLGVDSTFVAGPCESALPLRARADGVVTMLAALGNIRESRHCLFQIISLEGCGRLLSMWDNTTFELHDPVSWCCTRTLGTIVAIDSKAPDLVARVTKRGITTAMANR